MKEVFEALTSAYGADDHDAKITMAYLPPDAEGVPDGLITIIVQRDGRPVVSFQVLNAALMVTPPERKAA